MLCCLAHASWDGPEADLCLALIPQPFFAHGLQIHGVKFVKNQFVQLTDTHAVQIHGAWQCADEFYFQVQVFQASLRTNVGRTAWISTDDSMTLLAAADVGHKTQIMFHRTDDDNKLWLMS